MHLSGADLCDVFLVIAIEVCQSSLGHAWLRKINDDIMMYMAQSSSNGLEQISLINYKGDKKANAGAERRNKLNKDIKVIYQKVHGYTIIKYSVSDQ